MGTALLVVALLVSLVGWIMVVGLAFRESILWGLGTIFVPFVYLIFAITHWEIAKKGFLIGVAGSVMFIVSVALSPAPKKIVPQPAQEKASMAPVTTTHATFEQVTAHAPEPVSAPVTQTEEPIQPLFAQVWADNRTRLYWPKECAKHPETAYLLAKSVANSQGFKAAECK